MSDIVTAKCWTGDGKVGIVFDVTDWFRSATPEEIKELASENWGDPTGIDPLTYYYSFAATDIAWEYSSTATSPIYDHIDKCQSVATQINIECIINKSQALAWLSHHRPDLYQLLTGAEDSPT